MITVVGPAFWDVVIDVGKMPEEGSLHQGQVISENPGGAACNTAAWIAYHDTDVYLYTRRGYGKYADLFYKACEDLPSKGFRLHLELLPATTEDLGTCFILLTENKQRTVIWTKGQEKSLYEPEFNDYRTKMLASSKVAWLQLGSEDRRQGYWERTEGALRGLPIWHLQEELQAGREWEFLVGSVEDAPLPKKDELEKLGCRLAVITQGKDGALYSFEGGDWETYPALEIQEVVDTTGAGDAFLAGLLVGLKDGLPANSAGLDTINYALRLANQYSSLAVQRQGSWPQKSQD